MCTTTAHTILGQRQSKASEVRWMSTTALVIILEFAFALFTCGSVENMSAHFLLPTWIYFQNIPPQDAQIAQLVEREPIYRGLLLDPAGTGLTPTCGPLLHAIPPLPPLSRLQLSC